MIRRLHPHETTQQSLMRVGPAKKQTMFPKALAPPLFFASWDLKIGSADPDTTLRFFFFFSPIRFIIFALLFSLSLLVVTQIRGHIAGSSTALPTMVRAVHFYLENVSALSSLVDSHRIVLTHARRSQQLILLIFWK